VTAIASRWIYTQDRIEPEIDVQALSA